MRVYSLVFLTSSALSSRVDGVLEPASSNVTALDFPAVVRPLPDNDDDATASRSSTRDGPPDADERGIFDFLSIISKPMRERVELQNLRNRVLVNDLDAALRNEELRELYRRYEASDQSLIDHLTKRYRAENMARVFSTALKASKDNPARFQEPATTVEKLAMDQLTSWQKEKKKLSDVFDILKLDDTRHGTSTLQANLASRKIRAFINYSKLTAAENGEMAYLDVLIKRYGGEAQFLLLLRAAKNDHPLSVHVLQVEDDFWKMCALNGVAPSTAFDKVWPGLFKTEWFDEKMVGRMVKYVNDYNKNKPAAQPITVIDVLQQKLGGEKRLVNFLFRMNIPNAMLQNMSPSEKNRYWSWTNEVSKGIMSNFIHELFQRWYSKTFKPTEHLQERIGHLDAAVQVVIKLKYADFYNRRRTPPE
ncbi:unnamed protein product [Hyaloperonospora brassicae]|uniref:RxLR effector candidate protein n=1 Tax=Hyaloperonospora brassicae TaxID=162125 RepID=A0AAV0U7W5_HYABA|nr:unnamed protein product [Hyaloperonospora brassicae]